MQNYDDLLKENLEWVETKLSLDKDYFKNLSKGQNPPFLYIGCSDSRMPIDTFTQSEPGSFFIHRNIANQVFPNDMNFLATLEYAVEQLGVQHIIVSGHYECGGIRTAHEKCRHSAMISNWLMPIKKIEVEHKKELELLENEDDRLDRLTELNVLEQLKHIFELSIIRNRIESGKYPKIHGWILDIRHGKIKEIEIPMEDWKSKGIIPKEYEK
ncbi:MAG: carbonic anhydrase [Cetobacterium sp.]|uniref:carbonic anhydrase n=1 Tax=Cetobacterium sp. TaxID=2071632 RepID=UPI002FCAA5DE